MASRTEMVPGLTFRAEVRPESLNAEARTVELVFSTGAAVERYDWRSDSRYLETLSLKPAAVRLDRLNSSAPFLNAHSAYDLSSVIGVIVPQTARVAGGQGHATVRLSQRADVEPIWQDIRDGIIRNVSVGYRVHTYEQTEARDGQPMRRHATDWEPYEISAVPMPADAGAQIRAETPHVNVNPCLIVVAGEGARAMDERQEKPQPDPEPEPAPEPHHGNPSDPGAPLGAPPEQQQAALTEQQRGTERERLRCAAIMTAVLSVKLQPSMAHKLIADGAPIEEAQRQVIEALARRGQDQLGPVKGPAGTAAAFGRDEHDHVRSGIENALLHRIKPEWFPLDGAGKLYANRRMIGLAECWLQACGVRTTAMDTREIAGLALGLNVRAGYHTTSDFSNLLADVMGKTLRRAYEEAPQSFGSITARKELVDFKPVKRTQLSEAPQLVQVNEHGEFTSGTMGDAKEQYQLATYGRTFGITRQALVNDDLDAFSSLAVKFGRSARQLESDLVWVQITSNPVMGDGVALFHATHGNLSATSDAIAVPPIGAGRSAMRLQKGLLGVEFLNIEPRYLIVPTSKETLANQFVSQNLLASQPSNINPFAGKLEVITDPRLDAASAVSWYLAGSINQVDIIELGFLTGTNGPMVESQIGFKVDGIEVKCRHDVAAKVIDWRGLWRNPGA